jgi:hypothetical protein
VRRLAVLLPGLGLVLALPGIATADHPAPDLGQAPGFTTGANQGGIDGVEFEMVKSFFTGNPHTDLDFFSQGGTTYVSVGTLAVAPNNGGQSIFRLTDDEGRVSADTIEFVAGHPSASCVSNPAAALGLQHDVEATPKGGSVMVQTNLTDHDGAVLGDTQLLLDATDAPGRCHDQGLGGLQGAPQGGLEIIDVTDVANPVEIGLTSHIGEAHTVNVDPRRPHIAYVVTSDSVGVNAERERANETGPTNGLDGFEIVDLSSCMTAPFGTMPDGLDVDGKRAACQPQVWRYRYPNVEMALGHNRQGNIYGCHELETWDDDTLTCGGGNALIVLDMSNVFAAGEDGVERPDADPMPCRLRDSSTVGPTATGAPVTDCVAGEDADGPVDLRVQPWIAAGQPGDVTELVEHLGTAHHQGRQATGGDVTDPAFPATEEIDFNHEVEYTHSRDFVLATDERGGGVVPPGATCAQSLDNPVGNGGVHAYAVDRLFQTGEGDDIPQPGAGTDDAWDSYALTPEGDKAIFRAPVNTPGTATECTSHVFQQLPAEGDGSMGRIFMGWYTQGTQVVDYRENEDGTFEFASVGYFIPEQANQWVSHVFSCEVQQDGRIDYYGVIGDFLVGNGRSAVEVYKATLPPLGSAFDDGAAALTEAPEFCVTAASGPGTVVPGPDGPGTGGGGGSGGGGGAGGGAAQAPAAATAARALPATGADLGLLVLAGTLLPAALATRALRRRFSATSPQG